MTKGGHIILSQLPYKMGQKYKEVSCNIIPAKFQMSGAEEEDSASQRYSVQERLSVTRAKLYPADFREKKS